MTHPVDKALFKELAAQNPADVCRRTSCTYDETGRVYTLSVWDDIYAIYPHEFRIDRLSRNLPPPHEYLYVFIIHYLLNAGEADVGNEWISEKDIPGGATFFRGPHEIPTHLITHRYNGNIHAFKKTCAQLNGVPLSMADASFVFTITSRLPVAVLYWDGDEDFPPAAKILYDKSVIGSLALDVLFALAVDICARIGAEV
jgi:hypothetical protein